MKVIRISFCFCALIVLTMAAVSAQSGAVVLKGEDISAWYHWDGESVLALESSDSEGFCGPELGDLLWLDWMAVIRPDGSVKYHERGFYFTRVFYPVTLDDFFADPCALWNDESLLVAEGITHLSYNDNDVDALHPHRQNVWGITVAGMLYDVAGLCEDGMVELNTVMKYKWNKDYSASDYPGCLPDCVVPLAVKGPRLSCPE